LVNYRQKLIRCLNQIGKQQYSRTDLPVDNITGKNRKFAALLILQIKVFTKIHYTFEFQIRQK